MARRLIVPVLRQLFFLMMLPADVDAAADLAFVSGAVRDSKGAVVSGAEVSLVDARRVVVRTATTDAQGHFTLPDVPPARYILVVTTKGLAPHQQVLEVDSGASMSVDIAAMPETFSQEMVVTAAPGVVQDRSALSQPVNVIRLESIVGRAHLLAVWKNFIKCRSERRPVRTTPATRVGMTDTRWRWERVLSRRLFSARERLSDSARAIYPKGWTKTLPQLALKHAA